MERKLFLGGFGGQGVVYGGKMLGAAAVENGIFATTYASYSPAMRNGFTYSTVIVSPEPVLAPVTTYYDCMAFFDEASCDKQSHLLGKGGVYILNTSLIRHAPAQAGAPVVKLDATRLANELGDSRMLNILMLGAVIGAAGIIEPEWFKAHIGKVFQSKPAVAQANVKAFDVGFDAALAQMKRG